MTVQNLYTQYLDGKITKQKFLYEVRRDQNLTMISPSNSFDDVVKILKNKSIISEKAHKESTGKQEVEIIAKTIDMVNPYEYNRGMEYELNIMDVPVTSGDLSEENILKAQKKVLANLTKNPQYYCEKVHGKGEVSEEWVEATKKEIDKIGKGKAAKGLMREGVEVGKKVTFTNKNDGNKYTGVVVRDLGNGKFTFKADQDGKTYSTDGMGSNWVINETSRPGYHPDGTPKSNDEMSDDEREAFYNDSDFLDEHGQYADRVADVNADSSPLNEREKAIYEKYCQKTGIPMENLMAMVREAKAKKMEEAIALKDKAGNTQYAKDSTEASNIERAAKAKGVILTKTAV